MKIVIGKNSVFFCPSSNFVASVKVNYREGLRRKPWSCGLQLHNKHTLMPNELWMQKGNKTYLSWPDLLRPQDVWKFVPWKPTCLDNLVSYPRKPVGFHVLLSHVYDFDLINIQDYLIWDGYGLEHNFLCHFFTNDCVFSIPSGESTDLGVWNTL